MFETMVIQQALIDHIKEELTTIQEFQLSKTLSSTMNGQSVGGSQFIVGLQESEMNAEKCIVHVRNPKFSEEVPALLDDVVGFIAEYIAKYCDGMSVVVWSDHRHDGMIFHGHPKYRSGEAWNDWAMIKWQTTETGKDGLSIDIESHFEGQIYGFVDLHDTCALDFCFYGDRFLPVLQERGPAIYAIINSVMSLSQETFNLSVVRKGVLEMGCNGRRTFCLVDVETISDVAFGVFNIGGPVGEVLFLERQQIWANHFHD